MKTCSRCRTDKPPEAFSKNATKKCGFNSYCKECQGEYGKTWGTKEYFAQKAREYRARHPDRIRDAEKAYRFKRHDDILALNSAYRARRKGAGGTFTAADVEKVRSLQKNKCGICKDELTKSFHRDHIMPLKLGGTNDAANLQLLCRSCNSRKQAQHPIKYMQSIGYLL